MSGDFEIQQETSHIEIYRSEHAQAIVDNQALGVQQTAPEKRDAHAGLEQFLIIRFAGMANQE